MTKNFAEMLAAWIVALALIGAIAAHTFLPKTPPHLAGVTPAHTPRTTALRDGPSNLSESGLPLVEFGLPEAVTGEPDQDVATPDAPSGRGSDLSGAGRLPLRS